MRVIPNQARCVVLRIVKRRYSVRLVDVIEQLGLGLRGQNLNLWRIDMKALEFTDIVPNCSLRVLLETNNVKGLNQELGMRPA